MCGITSTTLNACGPSALSLWYFPHWLLRANTTVIHSSLFCMIWLSTWFKMEQYKGVHLQLITQYCMNLNFLYKKLKGQFTQNYTFKTLYSPSCHPPQWKSVGTNVVLDPIVFLCTDKNYLFFIISSFVFQRSNSHVWNDVIMSNERM